MVTNLRREDLARLAALEEMHAERAVTLAANWPGDEADAFHHAAIVLALREARTALAEADALRQGTCGTCAHWKRGWPTVSGRPTGECLNRTSLAWTAAPGRGDEWVACTTSDDGCIKGWAARMGHTR